VVSERTGHLWGSRFKPEGFEDERKVSGIDDEQRDERYRQCSGRMSGRSMIPSCSAIHCSA